MPVLAAIAVIFAVAVAVQMGTVVGADAAFMFRLAALGVLAAGALVALWLYHRRRSAELIVARYHLRGDALGWRQVSLLGEQSARICAECAAMVIDYHSQEAHAEWHEQLAELIAGESESAPGHPWTAITEPGPAVTENDPAPEAEQEEPRFERFRELFNAHIGRP